MKNLDAKISEILLRCAVTVDMQDTVENVAEVMALNQLSLVPVMNSHTPEMKSRCIGMVDANILERFRDAQRDPRATRAWQICTSKPLEAGPATTIIDAANLMVANSKDFLVVYEHDAISGYVSSIDVLRALMEDGKSARDDAMHCACASDARARETGRRSSRTPPSL